MIKLRIINGKDSLSDPYFIREEVFIKEQNVSEEAEKDDIDKIANHIVIYNDNKPIATGRIFEDNGTYYIGRVAVLKEYRGKGFGTLVVNNLIKWAFNNNINEIHLHAQTHALNFYKSLGFISYGNIFSEEGIEHISMYVKR